MTEGGGSTGAPDWGEMKGKLAATKGPDRMILIAGLLFFIDSFLPWYGVSARVIGFSFNIKGWSAGGLAVIAILCALGATAVALAGIAGMQMGSPKQSAQILLGLSGGAFVFALLRFLTATSATKYGLYIAIVLGAVMAYAAWQKYSKTPAS